MVTFTQIKIRYHHVDVIQLLEMTEIHQIWQTLRFSAKENPCYQTKTWWRAASAFNPGHTWPSFGAVSWVIFEADMSPLFRVCARPHVLDPVGYKCDKSLGTFIQIENDHLPVSAVIEATSRHFPDIYKVHPFKVRIFKLENELCFIFSANNFFILLLKRWAHFMINNNKK